MLIGTTGYFKFGFLMLQELGLCITSNDIVTCGTNPMMEIDVVYVGETKVKLRLAYEFGANCTCNGVKYKIVIQKVSPCNVAIAITKVPCTLEGGKNKGI